MRTIDVVQANVDFQARAQQLSVHREEAAVRVASAVFPAMGVLWFFSSGSGLGVGRAHATPVLVYGTHETRTASGGMTTSEEEGRSRAKFSSTRQAYASASWARRRTHSHTSCCGRRRGACEATDGPPRRASAWSPWRRYETLCRIPPASESAHSVPSRSWRRVVGVAQWVWRWEVGKRQLVGRYSCRTAGAPTCLFRLPPGARQQSSPIVYRCEGGCARSCGFTCGVSLTARHVGCPRAEPLNARTAPTRFPSGRATRARRAANACWY